MPGYNGPFVVRAASLGRPRRIEDWPSDNGVGSGPLSVPAGPTANSYSTPGPGTYHSYRTVPGSTWVKSPGCYAWQIEGRGFNELIVFDALAPPKRAPSN